MSTFSGLTAQDPTWKTKEQSEEAVYIKEKPGPDQERAQLEALRKDLMAEEKHTEEAEQNAATQEKERNFEGGFGGQEDLEDRYATTSGEH